MTKQQYVQEMLSEELSDYSIPQEVISQCAKTVADGLEMWGEFSGESIASSNRYGHLEKEKEDAIKRVQKELENEERKHKEEKEEMARNIRWMRSRYENEIEGLKKQLRS